MLNNCFGIINPQNVSENFGSLCKPRQAYMLPFGGRDRIVDFMLSNMVNHGVATVAVYTGKKVRSTMDHIGDGKPWELNRRINGLHIFPPQHTADDYVQEGDISQYYLTEDFLDGVKEDNVYIIGQTKLAKIDLSKAYEQFLEDDADVTLIYKEQKNEEIHLNSEIIVFDENGQFLNIGKNLGLTDNINLYLGAAFMKKSVFRQLVRVSMETGQERYLRGAFLKNKDNFKVTAYKHDGHVEDIKDLTSYYRASMNLLDPDISHETFYEGGAVYTRAKDEPPTLYTEDSKVENSIIANGCVIEGQVTNSIIFRGVKIEKGAVVKDSIVMQKSQIRKDAYVVKSVLDKHTIISEGVTIVGTKSNPYVVEKSVTIRKAK